MQREREREQCGKEEVLLFRTCHEACETLLEKRRRTFATTEGRGRGDQEVKVESGCLYASGVKRETLLCGTADERR